MNDELDLDELDAIFADRENENGEPEKISVDFSENIDYDDPVDVIKKNIHRANVILDKIQDEMNAGNFTARMVEVSGNIINSITAAARELVTSDNYQAYLGIRQQLADLKEREVEIKEKRTIKNTTNQNLILTNREDLLKILDGKNPRQIGEIRKIPEQT